MSQRDRIAPMSDYFMVAKFLAGLKCAACGGIGNKGSSSPKECTFCGGTGFKSGDVHLLVSSMQLRGPRR